MERRLLIVTDSLAGGLGGVVAQQVEWFRASGWQVRVVAPKTNPDTRLTIEVDVVPMPSSARRVRALVRAGVALRSVIRGWEPSVIHCHGMRSFATALLAGRRGIVHLHGSGRLESDPFLAHALRRTFLYLLPYIAVASMSASPELNGRWETTSIWSQKLSDIDELPFPSASTTPTFLWLGRLTDQKRADLFIDAVAATNARIPVRGVIAGSGPQQHALKALAQRLSAPVEFLGQRSDITQVLETSWAVVLLTRFEGMPLAIQEAMWSGRPIIASRIPPLEWLVGDAGFLVENAEQTVDAMVALCEATVAADLGRAAAERIRRLVEANPVWTTVERRYESIMGR